MNNKCLFDLFNDIDDSDVKRRRKWLLTINNPEVHGYTHEFIKLELGKIGGIEYWCMSDEIGLEEHTHHTHVFIYHPNGLRWEQLYKHLPKARRDKCLGTPQQARDYVFKEGKWLEDPKGETNLRETHEEFGECPVEKQGRRNDITKLYQMIKDGMSDFEIIEECPKYLMHLEKINKVREMILYEENKDKWRDLEVTYIWGITGTGKTRSVMDKYGYSNVFRVTDYLHPFDGYRGQDIIVFEEFRSSLTMDSMLKLLDGYPVEMPARYANKGAYFTKVYIITNIDIRNQYPNIQEYEPMTWDAFLRRIQKIRVFTGKDVLEFDLTTYLEEQHYFFVNSPFEEGVS